MSFLPAVPRGDVSRVVAEGKEAQLTHLLQLR
jgi:hypothetical protein